MNEAVPTKEELCCRLEQDAQKKGVPLKEEALAYIQRKRDEIQRALSAIQSEKQNIGKARRCIDSALDVIAARAGECEDADRGT